MSEYAMFVTNIGVVMVTAFVYAGAFFNVFLVGFLLFQRFLSKRHVKRLTAPVDKANGESE